VKFGHCICTTWHRAVADQAREEYVESELARRKRHAAEVSAQEQAAVATSATVGGAQSGPAPTLPVRQVESQRAILGKLMEVDLGEEARARTAELTERARKRLQGLSAGEEEANTRRKKRRLGPDGKPWRSRNRRGSDDIKRDQLVEEFLSENRCKAPTSYLLPYTMDWTAANLSQWVSMTCHQRNQPLQQALVMKA